MADALETKPEIVVEYTKPDVAKDNVLLALKGGAHVVVGTSGLSEEDYKEINEVAQGVKRGVLAVGNFAITAVLLQKFSEMAAKYVPHWEIIDYAHGGKIDAPSGTARELAQRLSKVRESQLDVPLERMQGPRESRGVRLSGSQVHSVRLPGYVISVDAIFGMPDQKLIIRHEFGYECRALCRRRASCNPQSKWVGRGPSWAGSCDGILAQGITHQDGQVLSEQ